MSLPFDPVAANLKVGIEVHQQLATSTKLFCSCPIVKSEELPCSFERRLRPSQSEMGQIDPAAVFEFNKGRVNRYRWNPESSCLVEADEEPPHPMSREALEIAVLVSEMLRSSPVDEVHVMRKIVVDGSNTSGFQRTAVVALGGSLDVEGDSVGVQSITLEEDAARILGEDERARQYALDRLGVPLVEIALDPITSQPERVEKAALHLGRMLRSTGRVARGLGTIRQDLNVSILGGDVVEVKGVQKLNLVAKVVMYEAVRQMGLVRLSEEIRKRGLDHVSCGVADVTEVFKGASSSVIRKILSSGGVVSCVSAPGLAGLLGLEPYPGIRLGKELAEIARSNSLGGVIHSDEFAKQRVSAEEEAKLRSLTGSDEGAALVLVAGSAERVRTVAGLVVERLRRAGDGVPAETRAATEEGETRYLRPRPGAARMYPETDIPDIVVTEAWREQIRRSLPLPWDEKVRSYVSEYSLSQEMAVQLYDSGYAPLFERLASELRVDRSLIASTLVEIPPRLVREGIAEESVTPELLVSALRGIEAGRFAKEAAVDVLRAVGRREAKDVEEASARLGIRGISDEELRRIVDEVVSKNAPLIEERGERAFSVLMGEVMKVARGSVDGSKVSGMLKERMKALG